MFVSVSGVAGSSVGSSVVVFRQRVFECCMFYIRMCVVCAMVCRLMVLMIEGRVPSRSILKGLFQSPRKALGPLAPEVLDAAEVRSFAPLCAVSKLQHVVTPDANSCVDSCFLIFSFLELHYPN